MASYKRVLKAFGRSLQDADFICDITIHPWEIKIKKHTKQMPERWDGNIRLVAYIDVFFLICCQGNARFQHGIIVYKDEDDPKLQHAKAPTAVMKNPDPKAKKKKEIPLQFDTDSINYIVTGYGHDIGLSTTFPAAEKYTIEIRRSSDTRIEDGLKLYSALDLMKASTAMTTVAGAEILGHVAGSANMRVMDDSGKAFVKGLNANKAPSVTLSASKD